ncbi:hypothetical protein SR882_10360 [Guyparkeria halophila]|uniref:DUF2164 family protein n=1 Tax=Guyparkeria halophila TaxID=47960 RepID=A0ABZ0YVF1_9GAMM|nr:hypothetical protein [Guyparkeria halophila]WQH16152.1 hypothetical protein SR882_10360 [Guyparkeria halophila]
MKVQREPVAVKRLGLSKPQEEVVDALAHVYVAEDIDRNVAGLNGFFDHYQRKTMTPTQRHIWERFQERVHEVRRDMLRLMKEEDDASS